VASEAGQLNVYDTFNVFLRRDPKGNNFKAVLETIRDLMNTDCVVPEWLQDTFLGYGAPNAAHYSQLSSQVETLNFNDTFLSFQHVKESFPTFEVEAAEGQAAPSPPFSLSFPPATTAKRKAASQMVPRGVKPSKKAPAPDADADAAPSKPKVVVTARPQLNRGPYPQDVPRTNVVPFTATQVEAIRAGMQPGLSMVVGPPGTGKTDVAVQIVANLYHSFPGQRTLIVTHSNQALNQLFEKIMALDIDERHLLRLVCSCHLLLACPTCLQCKTHAHAHAHAHAHMHICTHT